MYIDNNKERYQMKFTKKAFRAALKANNKTEVWHLMAVKMGRKPTFNEVYETIKEIATTDRDARKAFTMADTRKVIFCESTNIVNGPRGEALAMLRRLLTEGVSSYTKVPMMGHTHLYFCSPSYGHADYNKVRTCNIEDNEEFVNKIVKIGERFMAKHNI